ncbi:unnamed protein product [Echinostoma caproni]|uniref:E3 ubiquitin-protein ligase n=1 Tax=Echinostoma caproni TaxID=27848 RepID=A0A183AXG4_9TREM|nr:unnamed protein product [Echinostoma caproni]
MIHQLVDIWTHLVPNEPEIPLDLSSETAPEAETSDRRTISISIAEEQTSEMDGMELPLVPNMPIAAEQLQSNQFYVWRDWKMIWVRDLLSMFTLGSFVIVLLHPADGGLRALAIHGGCSRDPTPVMLSPGEPAVPRPGLRSHMLRLHQHLVEASDHLEKKQLWPDSPKRQETNQEQNQSQPEAESSVSNNHPRLPPRSSHGKFEINKANWRRVGLHLGLRRPPKPTQAPKNPMISPNAKAALQRQASSPARTCIPQGRLPLGTADKPTALGKPTNVVTIGPLVCSLRESTRGSRLCIQARSLSDSAGRHSEANSSFKEALLFFEDHDQGFCRVRISSVYPEGSTTEVSEITVAESEQTEGVATTEKKDAASSSSPTSPEQHGRPRRRHSASLLTFLSKADPEQQSEAEPSSTESSEYDAEAPELFDFDALFGLESDQTYVLQGGDGDDNNGELVLTKGVKPPEVNKELGRINEILFPRELVYETYTSGFINNWLCIDDDCLATENKDRQERAFKQLTDIRKQGLKLSKKLLEILSDKATTNGVKTASGHFHTELRTVRSIASTIWAAYKSDSSGDCERTLSSLSAAFKRLADLLLSGEQAITAYELTISGLVPALLLCLSASNAGRWACPNRPIGPDITSTLLWYLHERRRVFLHHMSPRTGSPALGRLSRRVVHAFELTEHLPMRLFALSHYFSPSSAEGPSSNASHLALVGSSDIPSTPLNATHNNYDQPAHSANQHSLVASLPLGLIRAAQANSSSSAGNDNNSSGVSKAPTETQQFADCLDATELRALFTFCPSLVCRSDEEYVVPGMHQIDSRIAVELIRLDDTSTEATENSTNPPDPPVLKDWSNCTVQVNPMVTAGQLERFLIQMSTRQWYNKPRTELAYWDQLVKATKDNGPGITFTPPVNGISSIDSVGGVIDWLATDGNTRPIEQWANPALIGLVTVAASVSNLIMGTASSVLGPRSGTLVGGYPVRCAGVGGVTRPARVSDVNGPVAVRTGCGKSKFGIHSGKSNSIPEETHAWFAVDLGLQLIPTAYSMAYLREAEDFNVPIAPRNWNLEVSDSY